MNVLLWLVVGAVTGRVIRVTLPRLLQLRDRRLPFRWPWVELTGALVFTYISWGAPVVPAMAVALASLLLAITAADIHSKLIPDVLTFPGTLLGIVLSSAEPNGILVALSQVRVLRSIGFPAIEGPLSGAVLAILGAALGFVLLEGFRRIVGLLANIDGMGMGDAKLLMMIGAFLGPHAVILTLLPACAVGAIVGVAYKLKTGLPHAPFGPALAVGALVVLRFGDVVLMVLWRSSLAVFSLPPLVTAAIYGLLLALLVVVMLRLRRRAAYYQQMLDDDYQAIEDQLLSDGDAPDDDE